MRIDRMYFERFEDVVKEDKEIQKMVQNKDLDAIEKYIVDNVFEKPNEKSRKEIPFLILATNNFSSLGSR